MNRCKLCDTLRNDADTGDECVICGMNYEDGRPLRVAVYVPPPAPVKVVSSPTSSAPGLRGVRFRHINGFRAR